MTEQYTDQMSVRLERCRFFGRHGVMPTERTAGNEFEVSVEADYEVVGLNDDDLSTTLSYADVYAIVKEEMERPRNLLETLARDITGRLCKLGPSLRRTVVEIRKITPPITGINGSASVRLTRRYGENGQK